MGKHEDQGAQRPEDVADSSARLQYRGTKLTARYALFGVLVTGMFGVGVAMISSSKDHDGASAKSPTASGATLSKSEAPAPTAAIVSPSDGDVVQHCISARLTWSHIPAGQVGWLTVQIPNVHGDPDPGGFYLVRKFTGDSPGTFLQRPITIGDHKSINKTYWLSFYLVNADLAPGDHPGELVAFDQTLHPFDSGHRLAQVSVTRDPTRDNATGPPDTEPGSAGSRQCLETDALS